MHMLRSGIVSEKEIKAPPVTFYVVATWLVALALGAAFWTLLLHVVGQIERL